MNGFSICIWGGWYGSGNTGDTAILLSLKERLIEKYGDIKLTVFSRNAGYIRKRFGVDAFSPAADIFRVLRALRRSDIFLIGGGTPFYDGVYHLLTFLFYYTAARLFRKNIMVLAVSSQDIKSNISKKLIKALMNRVDIITVREPETRKIFKDLGISKDILLTADPAILLEPISDHALYTFLEKRKICGKETPLIGISPRFFADRTARNFYHPPYSAGTIDNYKRVLADTADYLTDFGRPVFFPMHGSDRHDDKGLIREIRSIMKKRDGCVFIDEVIEPRTLLGLMSKMFFIIGVRFHSLVFGASSRTPLIAVSYGPKTVGFMDMIGHSDYICDMESLTYIRLKSLAEKAMANNGRMRSLLEEKKSELSRMAQESLALVGSLSGRRL